MPVEIDFWIANPELHPWRTASNNNAAFVRQTVPAKIAQGATTFTTIVMRNSGLTTWQASRQYALGSQSPADNVIWGTSRQALTSDVSPGSEATFNLPITLTGAATFQWQMVQDGVEWFGDKSNATVVALDEPALCANLRKRISDLESQIQELTDVLDGNPAHDAPIRRQIARLDASVVRLIQQATANGCAP